MYFRTGECRRVFCYLARYESRHIVALVLLAVLAASRQQPGGRELIAVVASAPRYDIVQRCTRLGAPGDARGPAIEQARASCTASRVPGAGVRRATHNPIEDRSCSGGASAGMTPITPDNDLATPGCLLYGLVTTDRRATLVRSLRARPTFKERI